MSVWKVGALIAAWLAIAIAAVAFVAGRDYEYRHPTPTARPRIDVMELHCMALGAGDCEAVREPTGELILKPGLYAGDAESRLVYATVREARCEINQSDNWRMYPSADAAGSMPAMAAQAKQATCDARAIGLTIERCIQFCGRPNPGGR